MKRFLSLLLCVMTVLSTVSFALPSIAVSSEAVNKFVSEAYSESASATLAADEWTHETYGDLVFELDFDTNNAGSAVTSDTVSMISGTDKTDKVLLSSIGRLNPEYAPSEDTWSLFGYTMTDTSASLASDTEHGSYLTATTQSTNASFYIEGSNASGRTSYEPTFADVGVYTIEYDYMVTGASSVSVNPRFHEFDNSASFTGTVGEWNHVVYTYDVSTASTPVGVGSIRLRMVVAAGAVLAYDNIRLYYSAPESEEEETENEWEHETYGTKLFSLNFDEDNDGNAVTTDTLSGIDNGRLDSSTTAGILISTVGQVNPNLDSAETADYRTSVKDVSSFYLGSDGDDSYLCLTATSSKPCIYVGGFYDKDGEYTLEITYKFLDNGSGMVHSRLDFVTISASDLAESENADFNSSEGISSGEMVTLAYTYDSTWENKSDSTAYYDKNYQRIVFYGQIDGVQSNMTGVEEICISEIAMYYKEASDEEVTTATVKLSANGNSEVADVTVSDVSLTEGIAVSSLVAKIDTSSTTKTLLGLSATESGDVLTGTFVPTGDTTLYMIWQTESTDDTTTDVWTHETYGTKLFVIDFDTNEAGETVTSDNCSAMFDGSRLDNNSSAGVLISSVGRINPDLLDDYTGNYRINVKDAATVALASVEGDNCLNITSTGNNVSLFLGGLFDREGDYTLEFNYKYDDGSTGVALTKLNVRPENLDLTDCLSTGDWVNLPYAYSVTSSNISSDYFRYIFYSAGFNTSCNIYIDDIAVYFPEPETDVVNVSVSANGNSDVSDVEAFSVSTISGIAVSEILAKIDTSKTTKTLLGISKTPAGALLSGTYLPEEDSVLYMLWKNEVTEATGSILDDWSIEFEYDESSGIDVCWRNTGYVNSESPTVTSSYVRSTDGYGVFTFKAADNHSGVWDPNITAANITSSNPLPAGLVKGIAVKLRYKNIPTFTCDCKTSENVHTFSYLKGSGSSFTSGTGTYSNTSHQFDMYYVTAAEASYSSSRYYKNNFSVASSSYSGDWMNFYFDVSADPYFQEDEVTGIRLDFANGMWHNMVIEIDYIRFIGDPAKNPESVDTDEIRTNKPMGVRFMASLSNELVAEASAYGWIIARETALESASISNTKFTYELASENNIAVLRGENFGEDRSEALNFSADDANVYFTAMLYNIPSDMYKDVLVARPFAVIDDKTYYGKPVAKSMYDVALAIKNNGFSGCSAAQQTYIQRVIDVAEND